MITNNKKGQSEFEAPKLMPAILIVVLILLIYFGITTGFIPKFIAYILPSEAKTCAGGSCQASCTADQYQNLNIKCKQENAVCCINAVNPQPSASTECTGGTQGKKCDDKGYKFCDKNLVCVTKCDYCAQNNADIICKTDPIGGKKQVTAKFDSSYKCACTLAECQSSGKCVYNFCSADTTGASYCCPKP
jgi:hypothetical protein